MALWGDSGSSVQWGKKTSSVVSGCSMGHWALVDEDSDLQLFTEVTRVTSEPSASFVPPPTFFRSNFHQKQSICWDLSAHPWLKLGSCVRATLHSWQQICARWPETLVAGGYQALLWTLSLLSSQNRPMGHLENLCYLCLSVFLKDQLLWWRTNKAC